MKSLQKYLLVAKNTWSETLTHRLSFIMWRLRVVIGLLTMYFLWIALLPQGVKIAGYSRDLMLTYILGTSLIFSMVISSRSYEVGEHINSGDLANFLLRPINYFGYWFFRDLGDKAMNLTFSIGELAILFFILRPPILIQKDPFIILMTLVSSILALLMYFIINFLLGVVGFWSAETWAPRFVFISVLSFFSGELFPPDILPKNVFDLLSLLPFSYLLFFPIKVYLGQLSSEAILRGILISTIWTIILAIFLKLIWNRGVKIYTAFGR